MADTTAWAHGVDTSIPSAARMYDYMLGGTTWFPADQAAAQQLLKAWPLTVQACRANRSFLRRAVRYVAQQDIRQFLDIGSGIPTMGNVHEIAQQVAPGARVLYMDIDPVAVRHSRTILAEANNSDATAFQGDLADPTAVLHEIETNPDLRALIDLERPVCLVLACVLHFLADDQAYESAARMIDKLTPGSYVIMTHATETDFSKQRATPAVARAYQQTTTQVRLRDRDQVARFVAGLELVEPGLVFTPEWRPDGTSTDPENAFADNPALSGVYAAVGYKPR
ncbi:SAM-dependent methyltransferase [Actinomycetes bacterium KLBMP 9797]